MSDALTPAFVLLTDAPPLKEGGHGCHVLAWNWIEAMRDRVKLVVTHRLSPPLSQDQIRSDLPIASLFYPDLCTWRVPRRLEWLRSALEACLFLIWLLGAGRRINSTGADRVFAFFGGNSWFLFNTWMLAWWTKLPFDVYLVDDLEESAIQGGRPAAARLARWLEPRVLRRAARVFCISPGYCEHLHAKYGVRAEWLPTAINTDGLHHQPYSPGMPDVRSLTFIGAVNPLYLGALRDCLAALRKWNAGPNPYRLRLQIMTYSDREYVEENLGQAADDLEILNRPPAEEFWRRLRTSWVLFLPYSFAPEVRVMVCTSFPTKLVDSFVAGRPILVYGPPEASVPRYFAENHLPLCVTHREGLMAAFGQIAAEDTPALIARYEEVVRRWHNSEGLSARLGRSPLQLTPQDQE